MAAAVLVEQVCVQQDQYPCCCCQDRITRGSDPLDRGRIYEELSSSPTTTTGGMGGLASDGGGNTCFYVDRKHVWSSCGGVL